MVTGSGTLLDRPSTVSERVSHRAPRTPPARRARRFVGWLVLLAAAVGAVVAAVVFAPEGTTVAGPSDGPMGLSQQAWVEYRSGERASTPTGSLPTDWRSYRQDERGRTVVESHGAEWREYRSGERGDR